MKPEGNTILPQPDVLNNFEYGKFVLSNLAAKRAKQLRDGAPPLVRVDSNHPLSIALAEIAAGKIRAVLSEEALTANAIEVEEIGTPDLGLLLPALDDVEEDILGGFGEEEVEDELDPEAASLSDFVDDGELDDVVAAEDSDTLSLSDIADEENAAEAEDEEE